VQHPLKLFCLLGVLEGLCLQGYFNNYIVYAMDEKECDYRRSTFYKFFLNEITDKCGRPFEFNPIRQLRFYHSIILELLREYKETHVSAPIIKAISAAESSMNTLLEKINTARQLGNLR